MCGVSWRVASGTTVECSGALVMLGVRFAALVGCFVREMKSLGLCSGFSKVPQKSWAVPVTRARWGPPPLSGRPEGSVRVRLSRVSGVASTTRARGRRARTEDAGRVASGLRCTSRAGARSPGGRRFEYPHLGSASSLQSSVALRATGPRCPQRRWAAARRRAAKRWANVSSSKRSGGRLSSSKLSSSKGGRVEHVDARAAAAGPLRAPQDARGRVGR